MSSSEIVPPPPGRPHPENSPAGLPAHEAATPEAPPTAAPRPVAVPTPIGTASADDLGLSLGQLDPDPLLEEFKPGSSPDEAERAAAPDLPAQSGPRTGPGLDVPPDPAPPAVGHSQSGVTAVISALNLDPGGAPAPVRAAGEDRPTSTSEYRPFAGLDLSGPPPKSESTSASARGRARAEAEGAAEDEEDEYEDLPPRGSSWPMTLLLSYASAVTLGLIWVLWGHRIAREREGVEADPFPAADTAPDPGHRAGQSRKLTPPPPLAADRIAELGQTVRLGSLEVTPLDVTAGPVILKRELRGDERRKGGDDALALRLRLMNVSTDSILVPLDEAFVRERGRGIHDSFIETGPTEQVNMFPLAVESEWSIVGQEFRELRPGQSFETSVITGPDALPHLAPAMTWRVRLRTDVNQTETLGVRFGRKDILGAAGRRYGN